MNRSLAAACESRRIRGGTEIKIDWISALLVCALVATLSAFFTGAFPYPYGWIVFTALLVFRLTAIRRKQQ